MVAVQTVVDWLQSQPTGADKQLTQMKLRQAVVKEVLANLRFETHVGDWLSSAHRAAGLLRVFAHIHHMGSALGDAQLYDHFLGLFTPQEQNRLGVSKADTRTPELLFASITACYPDNVTALQDLLTSDAAKYLQSPNASFADHLNANSALYHKHHGRRTLNAGLYMTLFPHTHRCDLQGRIFAQALTDVLQRLGFSYTSASEQFHAEPFMLLQRCCHELDTQEAQKRAAPTASNSLEQVVTQQAQELAKLAKQVADLQAPNRKPRTPTPPNASSFNRGDSRSRSPSSRSQQPGTQDKRDSHGKKRDSKPWDSKNDSRKAQSASGSKPQTSNSALIADDPTETVKVNSATAHSVCAAASHPLQLGRSPVSLIAADADAALAANLNLQRAVSFSGDAQTTEYNDESPTASVRRSSRRTSKQLQDKPSAKLPEPSPPARSPDCPRPQSPDTAQVPGSALRKRVPLRPNGGDVCDERDSTFITNRRAQLKVFERTHSFTRVSKALLRSPLTLTLADMIALVTDTDLVDVLVRLCTVLEQQEPANPSASAVQLAALRSVAADLLTIRTACPPCMWLLQRTLILERLSAPGQPW